MILSPAFTAICGGCGNIQKVEGAHKSACSWAVQEGRVRKRLARYGWRYIEDDDLCPACVAKFIYEESGCEHRTRENVAGDLR